MDDDRFLKPVTVKVEGLGLAFAGKQLFDGLDLELVAASWTCLLGRSGVGKSTLSRVVAGLDAGAPVVGRLRTDDGESLDGQVAWMAQQDLLFPWLTVLENVTLGARLRRDPRPDTDRAQELLTRVGLADNAGQLPNTLSGGMRQRAALARTLMENRPVVVLDEPFAAVDAITRMELQELAFELLAGRTVLMITHDPLEALRLGHRVFVLSGAPAKLVELVGLDEPHMDAPANPPIRDLRDPAMSTRQAELLEMLV